MVSFRGRGGKSQRATMVNVEVVERRAGVGDDGKGGRRHHVLTE